MVARKKKSRKRRRLLNAERETGQLTISLLEKLLRSAKLFTLSPCFFSAFPVKKALSRLTRKRHGLSRQRQVISLQVLNHSDLRLSHPIGKEAHQDVVDQFVPLEFIRPSIGGIGAGCLRVLIGIGLGQIVGRKTPTIRTAEGSYHISVRTIDQQAFCIASPRIVDSALGEASFVGEQFPGANKLMRLHEAFACLGRFRPPEPLIAGMAGSAAVVFGRSKACNCAKSSS